MDPNKEIPFLGNEPLALQKQGNPIARIEPLTSPINAVGGTNYTKRLTYTNGAKTTNKRTGTPSFVEQLYRLFQF